MSILYKLGSKVDHFSRALVSPEDSLSLDTRANVKLKSNLCWMNEVHARRTLIPVGRKLPLPASHSLVCLCNILIRLPRCPKKARMGIYSTVRNVTLTDVMVACPVMLHSGPKPSDDLFWLTLFNVHEQH